MNSKLFSFVLAIAILVAALSIPAFAANYVSPGSASAGQKATQTTAIPDVATAFQAVFDQATDLRPVAPAYQGNKQIAVLSARYRIHTVNEYTIYHRTPNDWRSTIIPIETVAKGFVGFANGRAREKV